VERAKLAGVNVYTIHACGLGGGGGNSKACALPGQREFIRVVADQTGGRSITNTNDFAPGIRAFVSENASYYLLGYKSTGVKKPGYRRIDVKVNRSGMTVRRRAGYYVDDERTQAATSAGRTTGGEAAVALSGILPTPDLPMETSLAPFAIPNQSGAAVAVVTSLRLPTQGASSDAIDFELRAFTPEGDARGTTRETAAVKLQPGAVGVANVELLSRMNLPPGRYSFRIGAHSTATGATGSVHTDVVVPDFKALPLSLSGVLLNAMPGRPSSSADGFAAISPVVPTAERSFLVTQRVKAFLRVYQGGDGSAKPVTLSTALTDAANKSVLRLSDIAGAERFSSTHRSADWNFDVPLTKLLPGQYLLTFEATTDSASARRDVKFSVR
jgi:hypothetical protein